MKPADATGALRLLAVCQVADFGEPELGLQSALKALAATGWEATVTTPGTDAHDRPAALAAEFDWEPLELGGLAHGAGARAVAAWPRAWRIAREHDLIYLNGSVAGRLLPALRGRATVLHVHDAVRRVPRHWLGADVVLADSKSSGVLLDPLEVHVVGSPIPLDPSRSGDDVERVDVDRYAERLDLLLRSAVANHRRGSERRARSGGESQKRR